jgi:hypothetical protein
VTYCCKDGCKKKWRLQKYKIDYEDDETINCIACKAAKMMKLDTSEVVMLYRFWCKECENMLKCRSSESSKGWCCCYCREVETISK